MTPKPRPSWIAVVLCLCIACKSKDDDKAAEAKYLAKIQASEADTLAKNLAKVETGLAQRNVSTVSTYCLMSEETTLKTPEAGKLQKLCAVEAPILYLEDTVASAIKDAKMPPELRCSQLSAMDAFNALAAHPSTDPRVTKLVEQYTAMCPDAVAKLTAAKRP